MNKPAMLRNIEQLFLSAVADSNYSSALKAQELLSKYTGVFDVNKVDLVTQAIKTLDKEELDQLVEALIMELNININEMVAGEGLEPPTRGL